MRVDFFREKINLIVSAVIGLILVGAAPPMFADQSICFGTPAKGRLEGGVSLPFNGDNFVSYSSLASLLDRNYVHSTVQQIVVAAYADLNKSLPDTVFKYGETGHEKGGEFSPHKTHQNGLSVDFFVPVLNAEQTSVHLPTHPFNRYGYDIEFDDKGNYENYTIDYEALAAHIVSLHKAALALKVDIDRVIFAPELQPYLFKTQYGEYLQHNVTFLQKRSWVRHDEHYHVDFVVNCETM